MADEPALYTIGYEGRTPTDLVRTLVEAGVVRLVDVRMTPQSRVKGFSLMALFERLRKAGIKYEHRQELGNPPDIRALFQNGKLEVGRRRYRRLIENGASEIVDVVVGLALIEPTAVLCREREANDCHRSVLADVASERGKLRVVHL